MALLNKFAVDQQRAEEGVWVPWQSGIEFKIARFGNAKMRETLRSDERIAEFSKQTGVTPNVDSETVTKVVAETILIGWKNIEEQDEEGNVVDVPYSPEKAFEILSNPAFSEIFEYIIQAAKGYELFRGEMLRASEGN